jgi:hypothetical protein
MSPNTFRPVHLFTYSVLYSTGDAITPLDSNYEPAIRTGLDHHYMSSPSASLSTDLWTPSRSELAPDNLEGLWKFLKHALDHIMHNPHQHLSLTDNSNVRTAVYNYCISTNVATIERNQRDAFFLQCSLCH